MKWLVTTKTSLNVAQLAEKLAVWGCELDENNPPIPLDGDEQVFQISGPRDLPQKVQGDATVLKVSPSSELTLY